MTINYSAQELRWLAAAENQRKLNQVEKGTHQFVRSEKDGRMTIIDVERIKTQKEITDELYGTNHQ